MRDYNVICDRSGFKRKRSECRLTWDGYLVSKEFWEPRQPQDFVRIKADNQAVDIAKPDTIDPPPADVWTTDMLI
jgi:hypothetical protein